ncbi:hypothetical protein [Ekhidna sp.]|jgi:hypothetical protein|uniref:hypothetical protein n=1 Tax=Ekhidna sp. TaxID=2608089 RepID=UPI0032EC5E30
MKRNAIFLVLVLFGLLTLTFCSDSGPSDLGTLTLEITSSDLDGVYNVGEAINATVTFVSEEGLTQLNYTFEVDGVLGDKTTQTPEDLGLDPNPTSGIVNFNYVIDESLNGAEVTIYFEIVDLKNQTQEQQFNFNVDEFIAVAEFTDITVEGPLFDNSSESFVATSTGMAYSASDISSDSNLEGLIDFGLHYFGPLSGISLVSPSDGADGWYDLSGTGLNWTTRNRTVLRLVDDATGTDFDDLASEIDLLIIFDEGGDQYSTITELQEGDVLAFETDADKAGGSKKGALIIRSAVDGNTDGDYLDAEDYLLIDIKVQN